MRASSNRHRPTLSAAPPGTRLLRAWAALSTCAAVGIAAWHFGAPAPAPAPAICPPPIVFAACAGAPAADEPDSDDEASPADRESEADEAEVDGDAPHLSLAPLVVGDEEDADDDDAHASGADRPTRYGEDDWDDDDVVVWQPRRSGTGSAGSRTGAAALPPGCLASPLCVLASLGAGGPVPDSTAGLGYLFGRARDDFHRGDFAGAARGFLAAVGRLPDLPDPIEAPVPPPPATSGDAAADRLWLCRSAALALAAHGGGTPDDDLFTRLCAPRPAVAPLPSVEGPATPTHG